MLHKIYLVYKLVSKYSKKDLLIIFALMICTGIVEILGVGSLMPLLAGILGEGLDNKLLEKFNVFSIPTMVFLFGVLIIIANVLTVLLIKLTCSFAWRAWVRFSSDMLQHFVNKKHQYYAENNSSELMKNLTADTQFLGQFIVLPLLTVVSKMLIILALFLFLMVLNPTITIALTVFLALLYLIFIYLFSGKALTIGNESKDILTEAVRLSTEILTSHVEIKVNKSEKYFVKKYEDLITKIIPLETYINVVGNLPRYFFESVVVAVILCIYLIANYYDFKLKREIPLIGVYLLAGYRCLPLLSHIFFGIHTVKSRIMNVVPMIKELDNKTLSHINFEKCKELLAIRNGDYVRNGIIFFKNINFSIAPNEIVCISGKSGSGKTTLINIMLGEANIASGSIVWSENLRLGYVPQVSIILDATVDENIHFGQPSKNIEQLQVVKRICGITWAGTSEDKLGFRGIRISGGQRQRISLARALYKNPNLLVLDEATNALDKDAELEIISQIRALGIACIIVSHNQDIEKIATRKYIV